MVGLHPLVVRVRIMFKNLFTALVRPHLEYANQVCSPCKSKDIKIIECTEKNLKINPHTKNIDI